MNNAKMWLVVKPTVGIPLFLGAVAVGSFAVHVAVLSNTSWVSDFLQGQPLGSGDSAVGPRFLPFADVATEDLPLSRLLRLSLFQVTVGMALVLLVGTLNRVMIVELPCRPRWWA
jgi:hypothetical protein